MYFIEAQINKKSVKHSKEEEIEGFKCLYDGGERR
jgi:hypothetical protein